ncbi:MAG: type sorting protein [Rhodoferax sp.]|nr:type sorting protein [Rhodoferax sp.]
MTYSKLVQPLRQLVSAASLALVATHGFGANLIQNGDFSLGNTQFDTQYTFAPTNAGLCQYPGAMDEGCYSVELTPSATHALFANFPDHTVGGGAHNMLVANGAPAANYVWQQSVTLAAPAGTKYGFSAWASSVGLAVDTDPANLRIEVDVTSACAGAINFKSIGTINASGTAAVWQQSKGGFTSAGPDACIRMVNQNPAPTGNDFAIDDIFLDVDLVSPTATADTGTTPLNTPVTLPILGNDTAGTLPIDAASIDLNPSLVGVQNTFTDPGKGTFTVVGNSVQFTPFANYIGTATASYRISANDGSPSNVVTITVSITAAAGSIQSVPTLSQWALLLMSAVLAGLAFTKLRKQKR